ncbi:hypothetical protein ACHQM5_007515 [Ranunculus cassubicifolius]
MATMQSLAFSSPISHRPHHQHSPTGLVSSPRVVCQSAKSSFNGQSLQLTQPRLVHLRASFQAAGTIKMVKPSIQFIKGTDEIYARVQLEFRSKSRFRSYLCPNRSEFMLKVIRFRSYLCSNLSEFMMKVIGFRFLILNLAFC